MSLHHITNREKAIVMAAIMSALLLVALDQTIISTAVSTITKEFNSFSSIGFIFTAYMLTTTVTTPLAGKLSDMYGRRLLLLIGVTIFTVSSLLAGNSANIEALIAWRAIQGIGGGIITANAFTIVGDLFSPRERGKWQGMIGAVFGLSSVVGPLLGGWLTDGANIFGLNTDWRWTFFVNVPVGLVALAVIAKYCPPIKHDSVHKPDYMGAALITVTLASLVLAVDNTEIIFSSLIVNGVAVELIKAALLLVSAVGAGLFVAVERRAKQPILPLSFYKNRNFVLINIGMLFFGAAFLGTILYLTQFNQQVYGATASSAGLMLLPFVGGMTVSSIVSGQLASRTGRYKIFMVSGIALATGSILSLAGLNPSTPFWQEAVRLVFVGLGMGMVMPLMNLAVQNEFEQKNLGAATSAVQLHRGLGSTVGTALLSGLVTLGVLGALGSPSEIPYIQQLQRSPQAGAFIGDGEPTADALLAINSQKQVILQGAREGINQSTAPDNIKASQLKAFGELQDQYSKEVVNAFSESLSKVFMIASGMMAIALILVLMVKEKELRGDAKPTSAE